VDQKPRYLLPSGLTYMDVMRVAVALEFGGLDPDTLTRDLLLSAQVRVNERQAVKWMAGALRRSHDHSWAGDPHMLLGLRLDPDLPPLYLPREHTDRED
jgi:hypothetical protein